MEKTVEAWDLIATLAKAPEGQLDASISERFAGFLATGEYPAAEVFDQIIQECAYASLASDFTMRLLYLMRPLRTGEDFRPKG